MVAWIILAFFCGGAVWYLYFYVRFENKDIINGLRKTLDEITRSQWLLTKDYEEYRQQNIILRESLNQTLKKNTDLTHVVSELSRYYYHVKVWSEKIQEMAEYFTLPEKWIEEKIIMYGRKKWWSDQDNQSQTIDDDDELSLI